MIGWSLAPLDLSPGWHDCQQRPDGERIEAVAIVAPANDVALPYGLLIIQPGQIWTYTSMSIRRQPVKARTLYGLEEGDRPPAAERLYLRSPTLDLPVTDWPVSIAGTDQRRSAFQISLRPEPRKWSGWSGLN